mgnify:CR=1 FL=1
MPQLKVAYQWKGAYLGGKSCHYGAIGGTWEEGPEEGQVVVSLQVQDRNYQPLLASLRDDPNVVEILNSTTKSTETT